MVGRRINTLKCSKSIVCSILLFSLLLLGFSYYRSKQDIVENNLNKIFSIDESDVAYIEGFNGNTGETKLVTDRDKIIDIIELLNDFEFDSICAVRGDGWNYRLILYFSNKDTTYIYLTPKSITIDNVQYISNVQHFPSTLW